MTTYNENFQYVIEDTQLPHDNDGLIKGEPIMTNNIKDNISYVLLYALSLATALGFNDLILSIFDSFKWTAYVIAKTTYVVTMFSITIWIAYYLNSNVKT